MEDILAVLGEDLLGIIMVIFAVIGAINSAKKKAAKKAPRPNPRPFTIDDKTDKGVSIPYAPVATQPAAAPAMSLEMLPPRPAQPAHAPEGTSHQPTFAERMRSMEGRDPCHEAQLQPATRPADASPLLTVEEEAAPTITLDFTRDELLRAVVMQEVLTRPCERRKRRIG